LASYNPIKTAVPRLRYPTKGKSAVERRAPMPHRIEQSECGRYILMTVTGGITSQTAMAQNLEAHAVGRELGIRRYLVDLTNSKNTDSVLGNYNFAHEEMRETEGIDLGARVAILVSPEDHSHDFIETVSKNAGLHVTLFRDLELAIQHLTNP